jgi:hypothetical protein
VLKYLTFLLLIPYTAAARIGETLQECERRYGPSTALKIEPDTAVYSFTKGPFSIAAIIWRGTVHNLMISKRGQNAAGISQELAAAELETFLEANRGESVWIEKRTDSKNYAFWESSDNRRRATFEIRTGLLLFSTNEYETKKAADKATEDKAALKGF